MLNVNIKGAWAVLVEARELLKSHAIIDAPARVVLIGSVSGLRPKVGSGFYSATKAALHVLTGVFAVEFASSGILVNAVAPGTVATPMISALGGSGNGAAFQPSGVSPLGRIAQPADVVDTIQFFLGEASKYVTGTVLPVDGGSRAAFVQK